VLLGIFSCGVLAAGALASRSAGAQLSQQLPSLPRVAAESIALPNHFSSSLLTSARPAPRDDLAQQAAVQTELASIRDRVDMLIAESANKAQPLSQARADVTQPREPPTPQPAPAVAAASRMSDEAKAAWLARRAQVVASLGANAPGPRVLATLSASGHLSSMAHLHVPTGDGAR
jgi:hypothetical protein